MKQALRSFPSIFIITFWVIMMGLLVHKEFIPENILPQKISFPEELPSIKNWGIYTKTGRLGFLEMKITEVEAGYLWENRMEISLLEANSVSVYSTAGFTRYKALKDFNVSLAYGEMAMDLVGVVSGDSLKLKVKTNGSEKEYKLPWFVQSDIMSNGIIPWFYISDLKVGDKFKWHLFNPLTQKRDLVIGVVRRSSFYYNKKDFSPVVVVDIYYDDMRTEFWVDAEGNPLKIITPWGWELEAE